MTGCSKTGGKSEQSNTIPAESAESKDDFSGETSDSESTPTSEIKAEDNMAELEKEGFITEISDSNYTLNPILELGEEWVLYDILVSNNTEVIIRTQAPNGTDDTAQYEAGAVEDITLQSYITVWGELSGVIIQAEKIQIWIYT